MLQLVSSLRFFLSELKTSGRRGRFRAPLSPSSQPSSGSALPPELNHPAGPPSVIKNGPQVCGCQGDQAAPNFGPTEYPPLPRRIWKQAWTCPRLERNSVKRPGCFSQNVFQMLFSSRFWTLEFRLTGSLPDPTESSHAPPLPHCQDLPDPRQLHHRNCDIVLQLQKPHGSIAIKQPPGFIPCCQFFRVEGPTEGPPWTGL